MRNVFRAFFNHWNLLFVLSGTALALLSGYPVEFLAVVLAAEIAYLGYFGVRFAAKPTATEWVNSEEAKQKILSRLPPKSRERFDDLRRRCEKLLQIAREMNEHDRTWESLGVVNKVTQGLNRHLWLFLRLLHTENCLKRFLDSTPASSLKAEIKETEDRLLRIGPQGSEHEQRVRRSLEDNLKTLKERYENLLRVQEHLHFILHELERIENKIKAISEKAVQSHDPQHVASQIDQAEVDMAQAEMTIRSARDLASIPLVPEAPPQILTTVLQSR
jgi:hypothetical protein